MADLSTKYLGLQLNNPLIVAASGLTKSAEAVKQCEQAGAGAVVLKSVFEEQIMQEVEQLEAASGEGFWHPEAAEYIRNYGRENALSQYLQTVREAKAGLAVPVIASVHCVTAGSWVEFGSRLEEAGADAIELNLFIMPSEVGNKGREIEQIYFDVVQNMKKHISIPLALKLGSYFSGLADFMVALSRTDLDGMVLFNRFRAPDFDLDKLSLIEAEGYSSPQEYINTLRWISILSGRVACDLSAATGIHDGNTVIKQLLAGANTVQLCTTLYKHGLDRLGEMKQDIAAWMDRQGFASIKDFRGKLSQQHIAAAAEYDRVQFMKISLSME